MNPMQYQPSAPMPPDTAVTLSPIRSVRAPSTRHLPLWPYSTRPPPTQPSSTVWSIPSKRPYTPNLNPSPSPSTPPIPRSSTPRFGRPSCHRLTSPRLPPIVSPPERPAKRPRLGAGYSNIGTNHRGSLASTLPHPLSQGRPPSIFAVPAVPKPKAKKVPPHSLAVDHSRPISEVALQPPFCLLNLGRNHIPVSPFPEGSYPERLPEAEYDELVGLAWKREERVGSQVGAFSDPYPDPLSISSLDASSLSPTRSELTALCGLSPRNNESVHLGEGLTNPTVTLVDDDDGLESVLAIYCGAVRGSALSMELELAFGGDTGSTGAGWEGSSTLEVSVERKLSTPPSPEEPRSSGSAL